MSDEKLSKRTKSEYAEIIARWRFQQPDSPKLFTLEELLTPLLARLERERDAARSEALEEAARACHNAAEYSCHSCSVASATAIRALILAPRFRDGFSVLLILNRILTEAAQQYKEKFSPGVFSYIQQCGAAEIEKAISKHFGIEFPNSTKVMTVAPSVVSQPAREREVPLDPMLPLSLTDVREATDMYVECDGKLKRDYRGLAVVLNARVKSWFLERSTAPPVSTGGGK